MSFANGNGTEIVISTPLRTAIGTFGGSLKDISAVDLGTTVAIRKSSPGRASTPRR